MSDVYAPHQIFLAPARARAELWRLAIGILMGAAIFIGLQSASVAIVNVLLPPDDLMTLETEMALGNTQMGGVLLLGRFILLIIALAAVVHQLHGRNPLTLLGPLPLAKTQFLRVLAAVSALLVVIWILPPSETIFPISPNVPFFDWLRFLPLALIALLIQVGAEELLLRGYLQQQLGARFRHPLVWMVLPSILFGLLHYQPDMPSIAWVSVGWATIFGLVAADLTARSGTLGPAIALHLANNAVAILFVSSEDFLTGLALYRMPVALDDPAQLWPYLLIDLAIMAVSWLVARLALRC